MTAALEATAKEWLTSPAWSKVQHFATFQEVFHFMYLELSFDLCVWTVELVNASMRAGHTEGIQEHAGRAEGAAGEEHDGCCRDR